MCDGRSGLRSSICIRTLWLQFSHLINIVSLQSPARFTEPDQVKPLTLLRTKVLSPSEVLLNLIVSDHISSYSCQALLVYYYITNQSLGEAAVSARLSSREGLMAADLQIRAASTDVRLIGEELHERPNVSRLSLITLF